MRAIGGDYPVSAGLRAVALVALALLVMGPSSCAMAFLGAPLLAAAPQAGVTLDSVLKQLDAHAADFQSLTADMERTKVTVVVNDKSTESGQIFVRRDDKMRIEITQPDARTILRDGDNFYIYNPKIHRVEVYDLGKRKSLVDQFVLLGFGTSGTSLQQSYSISLQGEETLDGRKVARLELLPKSDEVKRQISKIQLWLDESTWLPLQQQFFEAGTNDYFIIHYRNINRNAKIPNDRFKQDWPHGTSVVKPSM